MSKFTRAIKRSMWGYSATEYSKKTGKLDWKYIRFDLWCSFLDTFWYSWADPIRGFFRSVRRVIDYIPVVWNSYDWDHSYLLKLMQYKLKRMRKHHEKHHRHVGVEKTIKQLLVCEQLLDRLAKDQYTDHDYSDHLEKWYPNKDFFERLNCRKDNPKESKEFRRIMDHGEYMYQQDVDLFCKTFKKYHRHWWD